MEDRPVQDLIGNDLKEKTNAVGEAFYIAVAEHRAKPDSAAFKNVAITYGREYSLCLHREMEHLQLVNQERDRMTGERRKSRLEELKVLNAERELIGF
ncbi:MAG: hypothetical protein IPL32_01150 [Chloracidobacterium sp.]|nr:hypothetical protein [Chloracidobacterium sp.]